MRLILVIPDPNAFVSGGNRYNSQLCTALGALNRLETISLEEYRLQNLDPQAVYLFDSIYLSKLNQLPTRSGLLIHYLEAPDPLPGFDFAVVPSLFMKDFVHRGAAHLPVLVLPPTLDLHLPYPLSRGLNAPLQLLQIANYVPVKGIFPFLKRFLAQCKAKELDHFELSVFGSIELNTAYYFQCKSVLEEYAAFKPRVHLRPAVPFEKLIQYYLNSDLLISTSGFESFGMAVQEATRLGLPVLGIGKGNLPNLITEPAKGILTDTLDELVDQLINWLEFPTQLALLKQQAILSGNAQEKADQSNSAVRLLQWLKELY